MVDTLFKNELPDYNVLGMKPEKIVAEYNALHPLFGIDENLGGRQPNGHHKTIKMLLNLRSKGIPLEVFFLLCHY